MRHRIEMGLAGLAVFSVLAGKPAEARAQTANLFEPNASVCTIVINSGHEKAPDQTTRTVLKFVRLEDNLFIRGDSTFVKKDNPAEVAGPNTESSFVDVSRGYIETWRQPGGQKESLIFAPMFPENLRTVAERFGSCSSEFVTKEEIIQ